MGTHFGAFDILGPIMIGPSSSHTAGAAKLGKIASQIGIGPIQKVTFQLHGSFATTGRGHGTDKALLAGVLGFTPDDERLKQSFEIAQERGIQFTFEETDLGDVHPNTVRFILEMENGTLNTLTGSSIGGSNILITELDGEEVEFTGVYPTLITRHPDRPGIITSVTAILARMKVNVAFMKVFRISRGEMSNMVLETDSLVPPEALREIEKLDYIERVILIHPVI